MHWANEFIGKPWAPDATGPDSYFCWGLVRQAILIRHSVALPLVEVNRIPNGWRKVTQPLEDDVVLMRNIFGKRHVGFMTKANGMLGVLHSNGTMTDKGPTGSVMFQDLKDVTADGYHNYEFWRFAQ